MKFSFPFVILVAIIIGQAALACPHNQQQFICPNDPIVDSDGNTGRVIGVNVAGRLASINYDQNIANAVLRIDTLALGVGCIGAICVGDQMVDADGNTGKIIGLNPYNYTAAISYDQNIANTVLPVQNLSLQRGCIQNHCVGDVIVDGDGNTGKILAINYFTLQIAINYDQNIANAVLPIRAVALGLGCFGGNCVGDKGSDADGNTGQVIAINPYSGDLAISYDQNIANAIISPKTFMSSEYCATYGDTERTMPRFIKTHGVALNPSAFYSSVTAKGRFVFSITRR